MDKTIAIVGHGKGLYGEAMFLRSYTSTITVFSETSSIDLSAEQRRELEAAGMEILDLPAESYRLCDGALEVRLGATARRF
jgi:thioredoxin reductase